MKIVVVRDIKANLWFNPIFSHSIGGSVRAFGDECTKPREGNPLADHPSDYELYHLGEWDETTGEFTLLDKPEQIAVGSNYKVS